MSQPRKTRGGGPKSYADLCENCEPMLSGSTSKLSQGTLRSDAASKEQKENLDNLDIDDRRVLLAITVEIEDGCVEHIQLKEGDSAEAVAMKFCRDHALPEQFVAPLTEHIVSNIISISKEDSDIVFHSQEQLLSDFENSTVHGGAPYSPLQHGSDVVDSVPKPRDYQSRPESRPVTVETSALIARREHRSHTDSPLMASQKINRNQGTGRQYFDEMKPKRGKTRRKKCRKKVSERLIAPTITSMAKTGALDRERPRTPRLNRPLSEPAKAVYMRLYTDWIRHEHRSRDEVKRQKAVYQETVVRRRMGLSKASKVLTETWSPMSFMHLIHSMNVVNQTTWRLTRMRGKIAKQYKNYGELLYAEGLTTRQNHLKAICDKQKHDAAREMAEVTLKPEISKRAKNIKRGVGQVWSRLQNDDKPKQDQLQELRQEVWEAKLMECTFKPRINQKWKYDGPDQCGDQDYSNRFEQLFLDAESRRRRRAQYMQWYPEGLAQELSTSYKVMSGLGRVTFMPCINKGLPYLASLQEDWQLERSVFHRLLENASRIIEKKEMQEKLAHRPLDPRSGRALYKPLTGRKPINERNPVHLPIGEYLYKMKSDFDIKIKTLVARDSKLKKEQAQCRYVGPTSQRLLRRLKERGFKQIFDILDDNKDGIVDLTTAKVDRLNNDVVEDLTRLMESIEGEDKKLDFDRFVKLMVAAESKYHSGQQVHLGLKHKIHGGDSDWPFQSKMDPLSQCLATKRRKFTTHNEWYKLIIAELVTRQQKLEEWRKERQEKEMAQCLFKPELVSTQRARKAVECDVGNVESTYGGGSISETISNIIEKVQQEFHGFYFKDEHQGPESSPEVMAMPTPLSPSSSLRAMVVKGGTVIKGISVGSTISNSTNTKKLSYSTAQQDTISELDDLPKSNNTKASMFFGLLGA